MGQNDRKKKEEKLILNIFLDSDFGNNYRNLEIVSTETPDFIIGNEDFEITKITDGEGIKNFIAYINMCNNIENKLFQKYNEDYTVLLITKRDFTGKYNTIKKETEKEIVRLVGLNRDKSELIYDFYRNHKLGNISLSKHFNLVEIRKGGPGTCGGPGGEMIKFHDAYNDIVRKKDCKNYGKKHLNRINLIILCCADTFFFEEDIIKCKEKCYRPEKIENVYIIFSERNEKYKVLKM